jgi:hypothetical protein
MYPDENTDAHRRARKNQVHPPCKFELLMHLEIRVMSFTFRYRYESKIPLPRYPDWPIIVDLTFLTHLGQGIPVLQVEGFALTRCRGRHDRCEEVMNKQNKSSKLSATSTMTREWM